MASLSLSSIYGTIFMDLEMPLMNGYEATQEIRKLETAGGHLKTFICGLSAYAGDSNPIHDE
jgi:CheY-like chemotaxis protein